MDRLKGRLCSLILVGLPVLEKENFEFKPVVDLERDRFLLSIPFQNKLNEWCPHDQTKIRYHGLRGSAEKLPG